MYKEQLHNGGVDFCQVMKNFRQKLRHYLKKRLEFIVSTLAAHQQ